MEAGDISDDSERREFKKPNLSVLPISRIKLKGKEVEVHQECDPSEGTISTVSTISLQQRQQGENVMKPTTSAPDSESLAKYATLLSQLNYKEPVGSGPFDHRYSLEVLKNGSIIDKIQFSQEKSFYVVGRIPACDIVGEHPTLSRMHAVVQFVEATGENNKEEKGREHPDIDAGSGTCNDRGLYIYDLKSSHGTFLNKNQIFPNKYYRLHVGHVLKFGSSSRLYVVCGPETDEEEESEKTVTELMKERNHKELERKKATWKKGASTSGGAGDSDEEDEGISWGMGDDAVEEAGLSVQPFALDFQETNDLSLDNPKRSLHNWFEREGYDNLFYDVKEKSSGHFICTINLPLDSPTGGQIFAEVDGKGKKKDIMTQCALKACQILDQYGVLRKSNQEGHKRKAKDWEARDYYSSDEDTFLDRTGTVEMKRKRRMKQAGKLEETVETFDSLVLQYNIVQTEMDTLVKKIEEAESHNKNEAAVDPLDAFMSDLKRGVTDIHTMKSKMKELVEEQSRLLKLINIVKPAGVIFPIHQSPQTTMKQTSIQPVEKKMKILFGPRKSLSLSTQKSFTVSKKEVKVETVSKPVIIDISVEDKEMDNVKSVSDIMKRDEIKPQTEVRKEDTELSIVNCDNDDTEERPPPLPKRIFKNESESDTEEPQELISKPKRKRPHRQLKKEVEYEYDANNPDYSIWVPPSDQKGDGKTKLNEKLGY